ncbi:MAG: DUF4249 domain-containing protein [Prevotella sp.]|nr:DUF4249 domain-containing protein [Prevotella sp.]MDY6129775.1 DUF4249 domain-containing protein [Prevotella sp.]
MKHQMIWALTAFMLLFTSCENDLELDRNSDHNRLALNGYINADSLENELIVSMTDAVHPQPVNLATVEIFVNSEKKAVAKETEYDKGIYKFNCRFQPGDQVKISVTTADGKHHAYVEETIPQPIENFQSAEATFMKEVQYVNNFGSQEVEDLHQIKLNFKDNGATADFYRLSINSYVTSKYTHRGYDNEPQSIFNYYDLKGRNRYICTGDPIMMEGKTFTPSSDIDFFTMNNIPNTQGIFNDILFNGKNGSISVYENYRLFEDQCNDSGYDKTELKHSIYAQVIISSLTPTAYYYLKAVNFRNSPYYDDNSDLTGPVKMPSNVHGGAGMVGFLSSKSIVVTVRGSDPYPGLK